MPQNISWESGTYSNIEILFLKGNSSSKISEEKSISKGKFKLLYLRKERLKKAQSW